jgi:hypothetical protein
VVDRFDRRASRGFSPVCAPPPTPRSVAGVSVGARGGGGRARPASTPAPRAPPPPRTSPSPIWTSPGLIAGLTLAWQPECAPQAVTGAHLRRHVWSCVTVVSRVRGQAMRCPTSLRWAGQAMWCPTSLRSTGPRHAVSYVPAPARPLSVVSDVPTYQQARFRGVRRPVDSPWVCAGPFRVNNIDPAQTQGD